MRIHPWSGADLQIYYDVAYARCTFGDANPDGSKWITTESGQHVLIDKDGKIIGGMGGEFNGQTISEAGGNTPQTSATAGSSQASPSEANDFKVKGFYSKKKLGEHYGRHGKEYPGLTKKQYEEKALELVQKPVGGSIIGHVQKNGVVVRYDTSTGDLAAGKPDEGGRTLHKRTRREYDKKLKEDLRNGGRV